MIAKNDKGIFITFTLITLFILGCDFSDSKLIVINNSKDSIAFIIPAEPNYFPTSSNDSNNPRENKHINDSLLNTVAKYNPKMESYGGVHFLIGDSAKHILTFNEHWETIINSAPDKKLKILFIPAKYMTSGQYYWKDLYEKEMFTEKKEFTIEELEKLDWKVKYAANK